ncbi:crossover junction endodeoxyribonuclease RuvC [Neomicrococcus aestuarii]|uniref:Crossover junction endodeoxyribonuclease RuvC n=1 Tax=Neomicrococcus aestuarii TaxID=556325 RepID=A0A7W8TSE9_9MICC|nr:crossover junction endodeoxyribonuclease RuvC [Neomicrococcus aestuarii]
METNRRTQLVGVTVIGTTADQPLDERLLRIDQGIEAWLDQYKPDVVAIERVFASTNVSTVMGTAQASGIVIAAAARRRIPVALHTPTEVKAAVTGSGQASKDAVGKMVTKILRLTEVPKPADAADAIALAITHGWRGAAPGSQASASSHSASALTPAQKAWAAAEATARRTRSR